MPNWASHLHLPTNRARITSVFLSLTCSHNAWRRQTWRPACQLFVWSVCDMATAPHPLLPAAKLIVATQREMCKNLASVTPTKTGEERFLRAFRTENGTTSVKVKQ